MSTRYSPTDDGKHAKKVAAIPMHFSILFAEGVQTRGIQYSNANENEPITLLGNWLTTQRYIRDATSMGKHGQVSQQPHPSHRRQEFPHAVVCQPLNSG